MIKSYRIVLTFLFILSLSNRVVAQNVKWDSTYRPGKYVELANRFKAETTSKKDIIFLGNSITAGTDWSKLLNLPEAKNRGISGDITFGVLDRLHEIIDGKLEEYLFLSV